MTFETQFEVIDFDLKNRQGYTLLGRLRIPREHSSTDLHVFLHGQVDRSVFTPPVFHRLRSSVDLHAPCLFLSDPVLLRDDKVTIGWFFSGDDEIWPQLDAQISDICEDRGLTLVVWHGPSAGGYAAVRNAMRSSVRSLAFAVGPQNDPTVFPYWREYAPLAGRELIEGEIPKIVDLLDGSDTHHRATLAYSNRDFYHIKFHLQPIFNRHGKNPDVNLLLL